MKRILLILGALLVIVGGVRLFQWTQSPVSSSGSTNSQQTDVQGKEVSFKIFQTDAFTTKVPDFMVTKTSTSTPTRPVEAQYLLTHQDPALSDQIGITIGRLNQEPLREISAVKLRLLKSDEYTPVEINTTQSDTVAFRHNDGRSVETAIYWQSNGKYIGVVGNSSSTRQQEMTNTLKAIINSWSWTADN